MKHFISTEIEINASPKIVYEILTDFEDYKNWNPFIIESTGNPVVGEKLINRMQPPGGKAMTFKPLVTIVQENKVFEWLGHLGIPGIFDGRHRFELTETENGTHLIQSEAFKGILVRLLKRTLDNNTVQGFNLMNEALKVKAESS